MTVCVTALDLKASARDELIGDSDCWIVDETSISS